MSTAAKARYDGLADWYDDRFVIGSDPHQPGLPELLGPGSGPCLDIGCGTGRNFETIRASGREVVGLDYSADQLRLARTRTDGPLMVGDAAALPFADESFDTAMVMWISTDVDDFAAVLTDAARVLRPGGILIGYGVHPCFNGPHVIYNEDGSRTIHTTYRQPGWHPPAPWWGEDGIRHHIGMSHVPLAHYLNAFLATGLTLEHFLEPEGPGVPHALAVRARKPNS
ncbi:class I SAM-dependent methyltransferase [Kribbella sandramycini]|uniref:SAM-dependent methyltransferase n=1 Tax=Kribbella sandramycini TaxID=60450 RepID=A0A7Y4L326_9ACTN|nr:class I SAM-dependent methyltransferase [Kribbella sandramycini]MBB6564885.1 SAM-dependent methyltransferase [Kribbella sandramycini]NOL42582.1 class I SAM-dependent methyltransferase [Kribbella sandramycini]